MREGCGAVRATERAFIQRRNWHSCAHGGGVERRSSSYGACIYTAAQLARLCLLWGRGAAQFELRSEHLYSGAVGTAVLIVGAGCGAVRPTQRASIQRRNWHSCAYCEGEGRRSSSYATCIYTAAQLAQLCLLWGRGAAQFKLRSVHLHSGADGTAVLLVEGGCGVVGWSYGTCICTAAP